VPTPIPPPPTLDPLERQLGEGGDPAGGRPARPGQLTFGWRVATVGMWALVFVAFTGVWKASRELGLATWWLGPFGAPRPFFVIIVPFVLPVLVVVAALNNARGLPWLGLGAGAATALIGVGDLDRVTRLGLVEIAIGLAAMLFSLATVSGRYRS